MEKLKRRILDNLDYEERENFLSELMDAVCESIESKNTELLSDCLDKWEAVAELNAIPGMKKSVWERFEKYKSEGRIH